MEKDCISRVTGNIRLKSFTYTFLYFEIKQMISSDQLIKTFEKKTTYCFNKRELFQEIKGFKFEILQDNLIGIRCQLWRIILTYHNICLDIFE